MLKILLFCFNLASLSKKQIYIKHGQGQKQNQNQFSTS